MRFSLGNMFASVIIRAECVKQTGIELLLILWPVLLHPPSYFGVNFIEPLVLFFEGGHQCTRVRFLKNKK